MNAVMVWPHDVYCGPLYYGGHIGTACLHNLPGMQLDAMWWTNDNPPSASMLAPYDTFFVNIFIGGKQVEHIRALRPDALIVLIPDVAMDEIFLNRDREEELSYLTQLELADVIGYVSESNRQLYTAFGKPQVKIPIPIGTDEFFAHVRNQAKEDFILVSDHGPRRVDCTLPNMAALRLIINQHPELKIVYFNPSPMAGDYARAFGLDVIFVPKMDVMTLATAAGRARIGVDLYTRHGAGRHGMVMAYAGTPVVGSSWTGGYDSVKHDPWYVNNAAADAHRLLTDRSFYGYIRADQLRWVQERNSFQSCLEQWEAILLMIERQFAGKVPA